MRDCPHVLLLQETLLPGQAAFHLPGYTTHLLPYMRGDTKGCAVLVWDIVSTDCNPPPFCGPDAEVQSMVLHLATSSLTLYNIY